MFDRPDWSRKRKIPQTFLLVVLVMVMFGIWMNDCTQKQLAKEIKISNVHISEYSKVHVEVGYTISNLSQFDRDVNLILEIYDDAGLLLASALFQVTVKANSTTNRTKIIDKLTRALKDKEIPAKVQIALFPRKVF